MSGWAQILDSLAAGEAEFRDHPFATVFKTIRLSVDALAPDVRDRYLELTVFPEDVPIPRSTVARFWRASGGLSEVETQRVLEKLQNLGLLTLTDGDEPNIGFHDLQLDFLSLLAEDPQNLHRAFLDAFREPGKTVEPGKTEPGKTGRAANREGERADSWASLAESETYLWSRLAYHLVEAGREDELVATVKDLDFLARKNALLGPWAIEADLEVAAAVAPADRVLDVLREAVAAESHWLRRNAVRQDAASLKSLVFNHWRDRGWSEDRVGEELGIVPGQLALRLRHPLEWERAEQRSFVGHRGPVFACTITPDGKRLISAGRSGTSRVWDLASGEPLHRLESTGPGGSFPKVVTDGARVAACGIGSPLEVWNLETGALEHVLEVREPGRLLAASPAGRHVVSCRADGILKAWDLASGSCLQRIETGGRRPKVLVVTSDGRVLCGDRKLGLWDLESGRRLTTLAGWRRVRSCSVTPDGRRAVVERGSVLEVWSLDSGEVVHRIVARTRSGHAITRGGQSVVAVKGWQQLVSWNLESGEREFSSPSTSRFLGSLLGASPDGRRVFLRFQGRLTVCDTENGTVMASLEAHSESITDCALTPDGVSLVSASLDGSLKAWNLRSLERKHGAGQGWFSFHWAVTTCAVTPDGKRAVSGSLDLELTLWDLESGNRVRTFQQGLEDTVVACAILPGGRLMLARGIESLKFWDLESGKLRQTLGSSKLQLWRQRLRLQRSVFSRQFEARKRLDNGYPVATCAVAPGTACLVTCDADGGLRRWALEVGAKPSLLVQPIEKSSAVCWTPDGRALVVGRSDGRLDVRDPESGELLRSLGRHAGAVSDCLVTADGRHVLSASEDRTLKVWSFRSGELLRTLEGHRGRVAACALAGDGRRAVSAAADHTLRTWDLDSGELLGVVYGVAPFSSVSIVADQVCAGDTRGNVWMLQLGSLF